MATFKGGDFFVIEPVPISVITIPILQCHNRPRVDSPQEKEVYEAINAVNKECA